MTYSIRRLRQTVLVRERQCCLAVSRGAVAIARVRHLSDGDVRRGRVSTVTRRRAVTVKPQAATAPRQGAQRACRRCRRTTHLDPRRPPCRGD